MSAVPQSTPVTSQDLSSIVAVQLTVPDTNTQQRRSSTNNPLNAEYSLFKLETLFTHWAPDKGPVLAPSGPSCFLPTDDSAECDQDGVITEPQPPHMLQPSQGSVSSAVKISGGQSFSSAPVHIQPSVSQALLAGSSVPIPLRMQASSSQPPWSTKANHISNKVPQQQHSIFSAQTALSSTTAAATKTHSADKTSISGISSTSRTMSYTMAPQSSFPIRVSTGARASMEVDMAAEHQASLLTRHNKSQAASFVPVERRRKSYVCQACGKAFSGLSNLEAHERVHTGEKPFRCDTCGKRFSEAGNLKKHQRVHTGEKPFSCDQCGKTFAWICNLRTHQHSATGCGPLARGGLGLG